MKTIPFPNNQEIESQAAVWVAAIDRGLSVEEEQTLTQWLGMSAVHGETLVKCALMWDMLEVLRPVSKLLPMDDIVMTEAAKRGDQRTQVISTSRYGFAIAASVIAVAVSALIFVTVGGGMGEDSMDDVALVESSDEQSEKPVLVGVGQIYNTAVGEISDVSLADGSSLKLNTDSEVKVRFSSSERHVELLRGEVYFDVAKDVDRPFVVTMRSDRVTAIGTAFNIDVTGASNTEVLVTEGQVRVNRVSESSQDTYEEVFLTPGQKVVIANNQPIVSEDSDIENQLAWRDGMIVFEGESLAQAINEIDRYTSLSFKIVDQEIATMPVGGFFRTGDLEQLLLILKSNFGVKSTRLGNEILLSKQPL